MLSPSLTRVPNADSYLWTFPECPVRIHVSFQFIERLRTEFLRPDCADREVGGLLIGNQLSPAGEVEILDFLPLPQEATEPAKCFVMRPDSLAAALQMCSATRRRVLGYYRSHLGPRVFLRPEDIECIHKSFQDPANVFLVIRPHDGRASAGFFFWQDGSVFADSSLTFPFSAAELKSRAWATLMGGAVKEGKPPAQVSRAAGAVLRSVGRAKYVLAWVALLAVLITTAILKRDSLLTAYRNWRPAPAQESFRSLGLHVQRDGFNLVVAWDKSAPEVANAKEGGLVITDGANQPLLVPLTAAQLRTGSVSYVSGSDRVDFRLNVIGPSGDAKTESIVSVSRVADLNPLPEPIQPPPDVKRQLDVRTPVRQEAVNRGTPAAVGDRIPPAVNVPEKRPVIKPPEKTRVATRRFVPAGSPAVKSDTGAPELPDPPELRATRVDAVGLAPPLRGSGPPVVAPPPPAPVVQRAPASVEPQHLAPPAKTGSTLIQAETIRMKQPSIPPEMRAWVRSDTTIDVQISIDESGKVTAATPISSKGVAAGVLSRPAVEAARGWQFKPARLNGKPVASEKVLQFVFKASSR